MTFTLTPKDKKVIDAFFKGKELESKKLTSYGNQLDGSWMGGSNIASRRADGSIRVRQVTSRAEQTIVNYIEKNYR